MPAPWWPIPLLLALLMVTAAPPAGGQPPSAPPAPSAPAATDAEACGAPAELLESGPLPAAAAAIAQGRLRVLAVGPASVLGPGTSGPAAAWPARLEALLATRLPPGTRVEVAARGGRGLTAADAAATIAAESAHPARPDLVLWLAGTVEAVRGLEVDEMVERLTEGLERLRADGGGDAVLVDPQFSRFLRANADVGPYREGLRAAAAAQGAPVFNRYDLMHHWAETETVDVERAPRAGRTAATDRLNDCLARALAAFILDGVAAARRR